MMLSKQEWSAEDYDLETEFADVSSLVTEKVDKVPAVPSRLDRKVKRYLQRDLADELKKNWIFGPVPQLALAASLLFGIGVMSVPTLMQRAPVLTDDKAETEVASAAGTIKPAPEPASTSDESVENSIASQRARGLEEVLVTAARTRQFDANSAKANQRALEFKGRASAAPADMRYMALPVEPVVGLIQPSNAGENYAEISTNPVKITRDEPVSTFSIDVDTASYSNIRRMLQQEGRLPPRDAVRIEELINYFSYDYERPAATDAPFSVNTELAAAPWHSKRHLLKIGLKGFTPPIEQRPAANLVFLVDVSGSMRSQNKLPLVKRALRLLVRQMNADDSLALVAYAGVAREVLAPTAGTEKSKIYAAIGGLEVGGGTNGEAGIRLAYQLAKQAKIEDGINRVILASDGDFNVGISNIDELTAYVADNRQSGIAFSTLGFGSGNFNDALMEQLADIGNGTSAYIDSMREAQKVMVSEMQSTLLTIASDVKIQVEFNPAVVAEYRLIGYENRLLNREDFTNDRVDAGDIGAGHTVTALYELVLVGSGGESNIPLRYGNNDVSATNDNELGFVRLRYKEPGETSSKALSTALHANEIKPFSAASTDFRFAAAVAGFGELLRGGKYAGSWDYSQVLSTLRANRGTDPHGYRAELISLVELAQSLAVLD